MTVHLNFIFGFLGSGKTTLVRRLLDRRAPGEKSAVIVNEFGDVGIDGSILSGSNVDMIELTSGCLCCTLRGSLMNAVDELLAHAKPDRIIVEATGVAQPRDLVGIFAYPSVRARYDIGPVVTVVDSSKYLKLKDGLGKFYRAQVEFGDVIILNKTDIASAAMLEDARKSVLEINPNAEVLFTERCDVDIDRLLDASSNAALRAHGEVRDHTRGKDDRDHRHPPAESFVLEAIGEAARVDVESFFRGLPDNVWRAKGYMRVDGRFSLIQFSMGDIEIQETERRPMNNMVFIGSKMTRHGIAERFGALLRKPPNS